MEGTDTTVSQLKKVETLCTYLVNSLGLRHASEPTQSVMLALVCKRMEAPQQSALLQTIKAVLKTCTTRATQTGVSLPGNIYLEQLPASQDQLPAPYRAHLATLAIVPVPPGVSVDAIWQAARATPLRSRNQQLVLQQAMLGQGFPAIGSMAMQQQQLMTQTAVMMAQAVAGAIGHREAENPLRNLQIYGSSDARCTPSRGQAVQQLLDRAAASTTASAVPLQPERSQSAASLLALGNGSEEPSTAQTAAAAPAPSNGAVAGTAPAGTGTDTGPAVVTELLPRQADTVTLPPGVPTGEGESAAIPSNVTRAVDMLAEEHYGKTLPAEEEHRSDSKVRMTGLKKPAAAAKGFMKKPSSASFASVPSGSVDAEKMQKRPAASDKSVSKKPAAKSLVASQGMASSKKRPASSATPAPRKKALKPLSEKKRFQLKPAGCSTCRHTAGCCRSCWAKRGFLVK